MEKSRECKNGKADVKKQSLKQEQEKRRSLMMHQIWKRNNQSGITLIALIVTIIILLILAGVAISLTIGNNGLFSRAQNATAKYEEASANEQNEMNKAIDEIDKLASGNGGGSEGESGDNTGESEDNTGEKTTGVVVTLEDGTSVTLTEENYADYLGMIVTNYKAENGETGGTETVTTTTANYSGTSTFTVSTTYRLYYIDWDNKYGDGTGTVYLKADYTSNRYTLSVGKDTNDTTIKNLNPSLYAEEVTAPTKTNPNMSAVTWLLDTAEWEGLKTSGADTEIGDKVNYVVGAPSFEMFCDSYNTHYKLTGDAPSTPTGDTSTTERRKIFYTYPYNTNNYGYAVGPGYYSGTVENYDTFSSYYLVLTDSDINSMYYPGRTKYYWLASPSAYGTTFVMYIDGDYGGHVYRDNYTYAKALCPLVSLSSDVQLKLK